MERWKSLSSFSLAVPSGRRNITNFPNEFSQRVRALRLCLPFRRKQKIFTPVFTHHCSSGSAADCRLWHESRVSVTCLLTSLTRPHERFGSLSFGDIEDIDLRKFIYLPKVVTYIFSCRCFLQTNTLNSLVRPSLKNYVIKKSNQFQPSSFTILQYWNMLLNAVIL